MSKILVKAEQVSVKFGGLWAVKEVDVDVKAGEILGIIGPNGAGKSTLLNVLTGLQRPSAGQIQIDNGYVSKKDAWQMVKMGIGRSFQTIRLLNELTVIENLLIGGHLYTKRGLLDVLGRTVRWRKTEQQITNKAMELLQLLGIGHKAQEEISALSLEERRRVEIARALMTRPKVLLLDEPGAGFSPQESDQLCELILSIRNRGVSVVLVEHNMKVIMSLADRIIVLDHGQKIADGTPKEISEDELVIQAYLGGEDHA
ncbi:ABC transporter ATP-binding protein [Fictibacillus sp. KU28468]|uniref:ABC transporter ATP-binding protein n=1 Tax=Fictibacillus sp. KU28468 TaxID=2991053 RepID=UPI00223E7B3A|nr:ABC transporter ATP-binding protein [Fictibacillus sp. KU28468]UZJ80541.1 ABC transporter ATP-binding protein [Fictibacillus sp. KU28468]